ASLLLTLPGTPFIYYGEEIGMPDGPGSRDVEKRTPMRWESGPGVGFSTAMPWTDTGPDLPGVSVHEQATDEDSVLNHYRALTGLRNEHPALHRGDTRVLSTGSSALLALERTAGDETLYVLANLGARDLETEVLPAGAFTDLVSGAAFEGVVPGLTVLVLRPD
ncbi:MAG TPA: DUF3459 domain-containing protein, partial [Trueperaceae bacterium]